MEGPWKVRWNELAPPDDMFRPDDPRDTLFELPGTWNDATFRGRRIGPFGCATFALEIKVPDSLDGLAIDIPEALTASRLYANGILIAENGKPGTTRATTIARATNLFRAFPVEPESGRIRVVYQIANFESNEGGTYHVPRIGLLERAGQEIVLRASKEAFLIGVLLLLGIYHLLLLAMRRDDRTLLPLALNCLLWGFRFFVEEGTGHRPITAIWPDISFQALARMEVIPFYLTFPTLLYFFGNFFPGLVHRKVLMATYALVFALVAGVLATPPSIFGQFLPLGGLIALASAVYICIVFARAIREGREGSILMTMGCSIFILCGLSDLLQATGLAPTGYHLDWGAFALACSNSLVVARRYSRAFQRMTIQSQELLRLDRIKDDFLANTSHELRTPLHGIIGISESILARDGPHLPESAREDMDAIVASAGRLSHLVNDILDFSKLRHGDIALNPTPLDLSASVDRVLQHFRPAVTKKGVGLHQNLSSSIPAVLADSDRLDQILFNLLGNAVKFTDRGEISVSARLTGDFVELEVRDSGMGISTADRERVFEAFEQGAGSDRGGTGLGLSITRHLVEMHGGTITVESDLGSGSTFRLTLPIAPGNPEIPPRPSALPLVSSKDSEGSAPLEIKERVDGVTILAVDDEPLNLRILSSHLETSGHRVVCLESAVDLLQHIEKEHPALILLDVMMPGKNGFEACAEIRTRHSSAELPVVFVTARNQMDDLLRGYSVGGDDYLLKPFLREELLARVTLHLSKAGKGRHKEESELAGEIMRKVIELWQDLTQTGRADFAERSGIWNVSMDPDGWRRTQTLDKYLDNRKTPKQPRWQKVQDSARYVLDLADRDGRQPERGNQLRALVSQFEQRRQAASEA